MTVQTEFESKGFIHREGFLSDREIDLLRGLFHQTSAGKQDYPVRVMDPHKAGESVLEKIRALNREVFPRHEFSMATASFFNVDKSDLPQSINLPWHQDHESFFQFRQHFHYLNYWIVLEKDDPANANLSVVPFDRLRELDPVFHGAAVGAGATRYFPNGFTQDMTGSTKHFDFDLATIAETPELNRGDVLLLRGDVIHRTQNQRANRKSLSLRCVDRNYVVDRSHYYPTSLVHLKFIQNDFSLYAFIAYLFEYFKTDYITLGQMLDGIKQSKEGLFEFPRAHFQEFARGYSLELRRRAQIAAQLQRGKLPGIATPAVAASV